MTEQQIQDLPPAEPPRRRRTVDIRVLIASAVGAFVIGGLVGGGFGALIGYVAHPDGPDHGAPFEQRESFPERPSLGADQPSTS